MIRTGDIVYVDLPNSIGHQQGGRRYGVVVSNNIGNCNSPTIEILPSTTKRDDHQPTHAFFAAGELSCLRYDTVFEAESKWTINKFQVINVVGHMNPKQMQRIAESMIYATPCIVAAFYNGVHKNPKFKYIASR